MESRRGNPAFLSGPNFEPEAPHLKQTGVLICQGAIGEKVLTSEPRFFRFTVEGIPVNVDREEINWRYLERTTILVTGASGGLGRTTAQLSGQAGADVIGTYRTKARLAERYLKQKRILPLSV